MHPTELIGCGLLNAECRVQNAKCRIATHSGDKGLHFTRYGNL